MTDLVQHTVQNIYYCAPVPLQNAALSDPPVMRNHVLAPNYHLAPPAWVVT